MLIRVVAAAWSQRVESVAGGVLAVLSFSSLILFTGLGGSALWDRDEPEYAQAALEMQERGEWLIPTFAAKPFLEKPPLVYWAVRLSYLAFGVNEFAARLPSACFGVATAVATLFLGTFLSGAQGGLVAALILVTSPLFVIPCRLLLTDPPLVFFTTLSLLLYVRSSARPERSGRLLTLAYAAVALAVLCKGPVGLFPLGVFWTYEWLTRKERAGAFAALAVSRHLPRLALTLAIAAPWFVYAFFVARRGAVAFFSFENLERFRRGFEGHTGSIFYYVPALFLGCFPWSVFVVPYLQNGKGRGARRRSEDLLLAIWILVIVVPFSLAATKLPHYLLPSMPALACWMARFWSDATPVARKSWKASAVALLAAAACLAISPLALYRLRPQYASPRLVAPFLALLASLLGASRMAFENRRRETFAAISVGSTLSLLTAFLVAVPWVDRHRVMKPIAQALREAPGEVVSYGVREPSLLFYSGRKLPLVNDVPLEAILARSETVYVVVKESRLAREPVAAPYEVVERKPGFAENGGEMTLLLIRNAPGNARKK